MLDTGTTECCTGALPLAGYMLTCPFSPQLIYCEGLENMKNPFFPFQNLATVKFKINYLQGFLDREGDRMLKGSKAEVSIPADRSTVAGSQKEGKKLHVKIRGQKDFLS